MPSAATTPSSPAPAVAVAVRDQPGAVLLPLGGQQPGAALPGERGEQRGLAARPRAHVEPALVAAVERRLGEADRDQLGALVLHAGATLGDGGHGGRVAPVEPHGVGRQPGRRTPGGHQLVDRGQSGAGHEGDLRRDVVGGQQLVQLRLADPSASPSASTTQRGWACATEAKPTGSVAGSGATRRTQPDRSWAATLRSTAFTKPAGRCPTADRTRSTLVPTAACDGTRIASSWWAPSRSASSTPASTLASGRSTLAAITAS